MDSPTPQPPAPPYFKPMTLALALSALALTFLLPLLFARLPADYRAWNASVIGALALFAAARLGFWQGAAFMAVAIALKDIALYLTTEWWEPYPLSWAYFSGYVLIGWLALRNSASVGRAVATALGCALLFFLVSNYVSWEEQAYPYGYSFQGLIDCYVAAIPFFRGTFTGDILFTVVLFGTHAVLGKVYFPLEQVQMQEVKERI
jgi:hypothetical protein